MNRRTELINNTQGNPKNKKEKKKTMYKRRTKKERGKAVFVKVTPSQTEQHMPYLRWWAETGTQPTHFYT